MRNYSYNEIYKMAEERYPCPNSLLRTEAFIKGKINAFIEGFQEAMRLNASNNEPNNSKSQDYGYTSIYDKDMWAAYYHLTH